MDIENQNKTIITLSDVEVYELKNFIESLPLEFNKGPFFGAVSDLMDCLDKSRPIKKNPLFNREI